MLILKQEHLIYIKSIFGTESVPLIDAFSEKESMVSEYVKLNHAGQHGFARVFLYLSLRKIQEKNNGPTQQQIYPP